MITERKNRCEKLHRELDVPLLDLILQFNSETPSQAKIPKDDSGDSLVKAQTGYAYRQLLRYIIERWRQLVAVVLESRHE